MVQPEPHLNHTQRYALIFAPKLSTADGVSEVSGRGEGMAAVAEAVKRSAGKIAVRSRHGIGTTIVIEIPKIESPAAA